MRAKGLKIEIVEEESLDYETGIILDSSAKEGEILQEGDTVILTVSTGAGAVEIESVVGKTFEEAKAMLEQQGFIVNKAESYDNTVPKGYVISQSPEGGRNVTKGTAVALTVSLGEDKVRVPHVLGLTKDEAIRDLNAVGITKIVLNESYSTEYPEGQVCMQSYPQSSYIDKNAEFVITISKGSKPVTYKYKANIEAPTAQEAPEYQSGDVVDVSFVTDDGKILLSTTTSTFPYSVDYSGITSSHGTGTITMTYYYYENEGGNTDSSEAGANTVKKSKTFTRQVTFTEE